MAPLSICLPSKALWKSQDLGTENKTLSAGSLGFNGFLGARGIERARTLHSLPALVGK